MKLILSILLIIFFPINQTYSQPFYFKLHCGYGIGVSPREFNTNKTVENFESHYSSTSEVSGFSFGEGINVSGAYGHYLSPNFGYELEIQYSASSNLVLKDNYLNSEYTQKRETTFSSKTFLIIPSFVASIDLTSIRPYFKIGPIIAFPGITRKYYADDTVYGGLGYGPQKMIVESEFFYNGGTAIGLNSTLGLAYKIAGKVNLIFELNNKNISCAPFKGEYKMYKENGKSFLEQFSRRQKEVEFVDKLNYTTSLSEDQPTQELKTWYSFSAVVFSLGISVTL